MRASVTIIALFLFTGYVCMGKELPLVERIVGSWDMVKVETIDVESFPIKTLSITFTASNTFFVAAKVKDDMGLVDNQRSGTYALKDNSLTIYTTEEKLSELYRVEIVGEHLIMALPDAATITMKRQNKKGASSLNAEEEAKIEKLIAMLNNEKLSVRRAASKKLAAMGDDAIGSMKKVLLVSDLDAETSFRLREIVEAHNKVEVAKIATEVTDPVTGMRVVIEGDGSIRGLKDGKLYWSMQIKPTPKAVVLENGLIILRPNNTTIDPKTGSIMVGTLRK